MTKSMTRRGLLRAGLAGGAAVAASAVSAAPAGIYKPGTYQAQANGIGEVIVKMTFSSDRITAVELDLGNETASIGGAAGEALKKAILSGQKAEIDAVSGASITSDAVRKAAAKCIAQAKGEAPVEAIVRKSAEDDGDWLGQPPEVAEKDIARTIETEVVVVGCGTSGMFAVASAAESGVKVIGIDRFAVGTGVREGFAAIGTRYQEKYGTKIDKFDFITMCTKTAGGHVDQRLLRLFTDRSGEAINWYGDRLAERGVELWHETVDAVAPECRYPAIPSCHTPRWPQARWEATDKNAKRLNGNAVLYDFAVKHGAEFHYKTKMIKLERADGGRVTGLIAEDADGRLVRYNAKKGVVIATGGYCRNYKMLQALQPWNVRIMGGNKSMPGALGDGIRACLWVGAKMDETHSMAQFDRSAIRPDQEPGLEAMKKSDMGTFWPGSQPWLKVNADGERFFNESGTYEGILHADEFQRGHAHYSIFDATWTDFVQKTRMSGCSRLHPHPNGARPIFAWQFIESTVLPKLIEDGFVQKADTIEELAEKLLLPPKALKATVERYNELAHKGVDEDFGKEAFRLAPLEKAPFYGVKNVGYSLCTMDGIVVNTNLNAMDTKGHPIPGLFVIGMDSGGFFANTYPNHVGGFCAGRAATWGWLVGRQLSKA